MHSLYINPYTASSVYIFMLKTFTHALCEVSRFFIFPALCRDVKLSSFRAPVMMEPGETLPGGYSSAGMLSSGWYCIPAPIISASYGLEYTRYTRTFANSLTSSYDILILTEVARARVICFYELCAPTTALDHVTVPNYARIFLKNLHNFPCLL